MKHNVIIACVVYLGTLSLLLGVYLLAETDLYEIGCLLIALATGCLLALACVKWVWPVVGDWLADLVYNDRRITGSDPLEQLALEVRRTRSEESMTRLLQFAEENGSRTRVWTECAAVLVETLNRPAEAAAILERGAERVSSREDKALLLYRAASQYDKIPGREDRARELWQLAAERFPHTVYGQQAGERL